MAIRLWRLPAYAAIGWSLLAVPIDAQVPVKRLQIGGAAAQKIRVVVPAQARAVSLVPAIPAYSLLRLAHVQEELDMTDEQKKELEEITKRYQERTRQSWADLRGLSPQERQKKMAEIRKENAERLEAFRKQTEEVLLAHQLERLEEISFRMRAPSALANPRVLDQLGLNDRQKESLRQLRAELQEKMRQLRETMLDKSLEVLTLEQRVKLKEGSSD